MDLKMKFQNIDSETLPKSSSFIVKTIHRMSTLLARNTTQVFETVTTFNIVEWRLVSGLYAFGTSRQKQLVDFTFGDQAQTSRVLADLERAGLVRSLPSADDRRVKNFELTQTGKQKVEAAMPAIASFFSQIDQALSDAEKAQLITLLNRVLEAAGPDQPTD